MILCCGEALIDMLPRSTTAGEHAYAPHTGGAVFNTTVALGRLGAEVSFFSGISTDLFGEMLADGLADAGVDTSPAARSDRPTTLAFVRLVDGQASYAFYDEGTAGRMLSPADLPDVTADACFFGGISLVSEPCGGVYETLMLREADKRLTMIDPNVRPGFIRDKAAYRARLDRMLAAADIVKISDEDLRWIGGHRDAGALVSDRTRVVLLTRGAKGVTVFTRAGNFDVAAQPAAVVDTVGAGDTFNAGVLAGLNDAGALSRDAIASIAEPDLRAAVALGTAAAAVTVSRAGANPPWRREL